MTYLRNTWYAAAWSQEVQQGLLGRKLLDEPIVLFRDEQGLPVALADRCRHRFAPLSKGRLVGASVECPYHGLRYDATGACSHNPHGPIPAAAKVATYPLLERHGVIWIWMGAAQTAKPARLPDFGVLDDTANHTFVSGYLHINANFQLATDNLLDLSHTQFLHPLLGKSDAITPPRFSMRLDGNTVWAYNDFPNDPIPPLWRMMWQSPSTACDRRAYMRWDPPSLLLLDVGVTECGRPASEGPANRSAHFLTPETDTTTHYFWTAGRTAKRDDAELNEKIRKGIDATFRLEDEPMLAACQERMGTTDLMSLQPLLLKTDAAAVRARRVLAQLIEAEAHPAT